MNPAKGSTVSGAFKAVKIAFDEPIEASLSYFDLVDPSGKRLIRVKGKETCKGKVCQFAVDKQPDGVYQVRYHVLSDDGHVVVGDYSFTVKN